jgi:alkylation response protein AidB-like acyl-CoA dehydrogenase
MNVLENGSEQQKNEILRKVIRGELTMSISVTEPNAGSDIASLTTEAVPKDGGFSINGQKVFASGAAGKRNIMVVATRTDPTKTRHRGLTLFLVPSQTKGIEFRRLVALGRRVGGLYEVFFDDAWVPRENILGKLNDGWSALTSGFNVERAVVAANYLGYAERIFREVLKIANHRTCDNRVVGSYDAISQRIAEFAIEIQAHRLLTYRVWIFNGFAHSMVL